MSSRKKTRFNADDLAHLRQEADSIQSRLQLLADRLRAANLAHTGAQFYDSRVCSVSDRLYGRLFEVQRLLIEESHRHAQ